VSAWEWHATTIRAAWSIRPGDVMLHATALEFDVAGEEIWPALIGGGQILVLPTGLGETGYPDLTGFLSTHGATIVNLPASYFAGWVRHLDGSGTRPPGSLRLAVTGSECLPEAAVRWWSESGTTAGLVNAYGLSETTVTVLASEPSGRPQIREANTSIGRALPGVTTALRQPGGAPDPGAVTGELLIAGPCLAAGYLDGGPAERFFVADRTRWFATGDLVSRDGDEFFYHGRLDSQVKVRGVRIEPAGITALALRLSRCADARVVVVRDRLVVCLSEAGSHEPDDIFDAMAQHLPAAAVPSRVMRFAEFPTAPSGKVDERALRALVEADDTGAGGAERAPVTLARLIEIAEEISDVRPLSEDSHFFAVGGSSLQGARFIARLNQEFHLALPIETVFTHPVLSGLYAAVRQTIGAT
jgi:nonribosomal peptide synthetase MxcG